jgi:nucleotide-binding universal stress UspA family protein
MNSSYHQTEFNGTALRPRTPDIDSRKEAASFRTILVALDLSPASHQTLRFALGMAKMFNAALVLVHVVSHQILYVFPTKAVYSRLKQLEEQRRLALVELTEDLKKQHPSCSFHLLVGEPAEEIAVLAKNLRADLIIAGYHEGILFTRRLGVGQASQIAQRAPCSVLLYRRTGCSEEDKYTSPWEE